MSAITTTPPSAKLTIRPLPRIFAAEVIGLDLHQKLGAAIRQAILGAFVRYQLLAFRDQSFSGEQQIAFSEQFGTLERHAIRNRGTTHSLLNMVTNLGPDGKPSGRLANQLWHSDKSFRPEPSIATILASPTCMAPMTAYRRPKKPNSRVFASSIAGSCRSPNPASKLRQRKSPTPRPCLIRWCASTPSRGANAYSSANTPRISKATRWSSVATTSLRWKPKPHRKHSSIAIAGAPATC